MGKELRRSRLLLRGLLLPGEDEKFIGFLYELFGLNEFYRNTSCLSPCQTSNSIVSHVILSTGWHPKQTTMSMILALFPPVNGLEIFVLEKLLLLKRGECLPWLIDVAEVSLGELATRGSSFICLNEIHIQLKVTSS